MLIDLHAHSALSRCCKIDGKDNLIVAKEFGMDGFVLTNHYDKSYLINDDKIEYANRYINEYYYVKKCSIELGIKCFFGIEVTMSKHNNCHVLVYGVSPEWLVNYPNLYDLEMSELYELVHKYNGIVVQAHPLRKNINVLLDTKYLDGIELNSHTINEGPHTEEILEIAKVNDLLVTSGGDFHNDAPRAKCGVYLPDDLNETMDIVDYLKNSVEYKMVVQESKDVSSVKEVMYRK